MKKPRSTSRLPVRGRTQSGAKGLSGSLRETGNIAKETLEALSPNGRKRKGALIVVCSGNVGSGKTAFVSALAKTLGVRERVASPTFVLMKTYEVPARARARYGFARLVHIDAYRLDGPEELLSLGFEALAADRENLVIIEWGERVKELLPRGFAHLHFDFVDEKTREITHTK